MGRGLSQGLDQALHPKRTRPFRKLATRLLRWRDGILAYFESRITNAVSEGINNVAKVLKGRSYGSHDFAYHLLKIMDRTGALPPLNAITDTF